MPAESVTAARWSPRSTLSQAAERRGEGAHADGRHENEAAPRARWIRVGASALRLSLFALALLAIRHELRTISGDVLLHALRSYRWPQIALAFACTGLSFLALGSIEILALRAVRADADRVPATTALAAAFVAHAFSQSVGIALLSGTGVRLRAYARHALGSITVARVTALVTVAIAFGLLSLASIVLLAAPPAAPILGAFAARPAGALLALVVCSYVAWSAALRSPAQRSARWLRPPAARTAAAQIALSAVDWVLTALVLFALLPSASSLSVSTFLGIYVVAQTVAMLSHVPGGAGVFEATILALMAVEAPGEGRAGLAASLVAYRFVYYLVPLAAAMLIAAVVESRRSVGSDAFSPRVGRPVPPVSSHTDISDTATVTAPADPLVREDAAVAPEWLIDNAEAYDRMLQAIRKARRSVWMTQLAFDADCMAYGHGADDPSPAAPDSGTVLAETVIAAVAHAPIDVRILLNATVLMNTTRQLRRFFARRLEGLRVARGTIRVRGISRFPHLLHSKMVIVDGKEAFLLGSPFANGYWDDARHHPVDARRPLRELGGRPLHDVSLRITGQAVATLEHVFGELWHRVAVDSSGDASSHEPPRFERAEASKPEPASPVRIVCTSPRGVLPHAPRGATQIIDAVLEGIAAARSLIYVEHQYLSARPVVAALAHALQRHAGLELIVVLNQNPDITAYRKWQNARLAESGLLEHPRAGVFALWNCSPASGAGRAAVLNQVFVHSKVVVVDDQWASSGSANLDGVSLHSYGDDFTGIGRRLFRHVRNFDVNVVVRDGNGSAAQVGSVAGLRTRLWAEHLDVPAASLAQRPRGGWLPLWRATATANIAALGASGTSDVASATMRGFVLPYSVQPTPARQLADLGLHLDPARLDLRFNPGWLEVRFSPNWVRNMFV